MTENRSWAERFGFKAAKEYVAYMTKHSLWGSDEYVRGKGTWDKRLIVKEVRK